MMKLASTIANFAIIMLLFINFHVDYVTSNEYGALLSRKLLASDGSNGGGNTRASNDPLLVFKESGRGPCGWRAIARQQFGDSSRWLLVQQDLIQFYRTSPRFSNPQRANTIQRAPNNGEWMISDDLLAICVMYQREIHVYSTRSQDPTFNLNAASPPEIMSPTLFGVTPTTQQPIQIVNWWNWHWDSVAPTNTLVMNVDLFPASQRPYPMFLRSYEGTVLECAAPNGILNMQSESSAVNPSTMSVEFEDVVSHGNYVECKIKIGDSYLHLNNEILTFNSDYSLANTFHVYSDGNNNGQILREGGHLRIVNPSNGMVLDTSGTMNRLTIQQSSQVLSENWKQSSFYIDSMKHWQLQQVYDHGDSHANGHVNGNLEEEEEEEGALLDDVLYNAAVLRIADSQGIEFDAAMQLVNEAFGGDVQLAEQLLAQ